MNKKGNKCSARELCIIGVLADIKNGGTYKYANEVVESFKKQNPERFEELNKIVNG